MHTIQLYRKYGQVYVNKLDLAIYLKLSYYALKKLNCKSVIIKTAKDDDCDSKRKRAYLLIEELGKIRYYCRNSKSLYLRDCYPVLVAIQKTKVDNEYFYFNVNQKQVTQLKSKI